MRYSKRQSIAKAIVEKLKEVDGGAEWNTNFYGNVFAKMKFLDEIEDYPTVCVYPGPETREYQASNFRWRFLEVHIQIFIDHDEDPQDQIELAIADVEKVIEDNATLQYVQAAAAGSNQMVDIEITSIDTDQGAFAKDGFAVGEVVIEVRY